MHVYTHRNPRSHLATILRGALVSLVALFSSGCLDTDEPPTPGTGSDSEGQGDSESATSPVTTHSDTTMSLDGGSSPDPDDGQDSAGQECGPDVHESNETEATATILDPIQDCDSNGSTIEGVLEDEDDVDWYRYDGTDVFPCIVDPSRDLVANGSLRLCKFIECEGFLDYLTCPDTTTEETSAAGRPGCCSSTGFSLANNEDFVCIDADDSAAVYFRLDQAGSSCVDYTLDYHF